MKQQSVQTAMATIDLDMLRSFIAIVETGSMTKAASLVYRTPAAISLQVKKLEELLKTCLMQRTSRAIHLTPDGELLVSYARRLLSINQELFSQFNCQQPIKTVKFGLAEQFGVTDLPAILSQFSNCYPHIKVEVLVGRSVEIQHKFEQGKLDIGLVNLDIKAPSDHMHLIRHEQLCWVTVGGSRKGHQQPLMLSLAETGCAWRDNAILALEQANIEYTIAYSSDSFMGQLAAVQADLAIAAVPVSLLRPPLIEVDPTANLPAIAPVPIYILQSPARAHKAHSLLDNYTATLAEYITQAYSTHQH